MLVIFVLALFVLLFAIPVGVLVGLAAKKQKESGLLRFAVPDRSLLVRVFPIIVIGGWLAYRGKSPPVSPVVIMLTFAFFAATALAGYTTFRLAVRSASKD